MFSVRDHLNVFLQYIDVSPLSSFLFYFLLLSARKRKRELGVNNREVWIDKKAGNKCRETLTVVGTEVT